MIHKPGSVIGGRYQLLERLGQGGMATVYKAYQENLGRYVAIKFLHPIAAADPGLLQRFLLEARSVAALQHPHIVQVYDFDYEGDVCYMVLELIAGPTLEQRLRETAARQNRLPLDETLRIVRDIGSALAYAHARGVIHRDLKPSNIMLGENGRTVLTDFGLAKIMNSPGLTQAGLITGTPSYMAPEQILGQSLDARADVYALGVLLYRLVTGRLPFDADETVGVLYHHVHTPPLLPHRVAPDVSPALERAILKALVKDPARRFQSVAALLADLSQPEVAVAVPADATRPVLTFLDQEAPNNLPMLPTSFVGREPEIATIQERVRRPDVRLLTLTGPGGAGKTRLALQVAATLLNEFEHGVFFVNLAPLQDATFLLDTVAHTLGLVEGDTQSLDQQLQTFLRDRHLLLVLDNFEQVVETAPVIGELLGGAPRCKILATSREPLRLYGENLYQVPPLSLPNLERFPSPGELAQVAAIQLFVARAQAVDPDFSLNPANARDVAELCVRLDGLPLAIELIAAQLYSFPVSELAAQSANRLALLAEGPRDRAARQRTMRGAIDWSYELLTPAEQALLARLGVFAGKFTAEAAGAVVGDHPLATLVQKSLLQQEEDSHGSPRFWMLELLREYALERLAVQQEIEPLRQKQAAYYLSLAETAEPHLTGPEQAAWFEQLEAAHDNFRAALGWALERGGEETALRLAGVLWRLWAVHSHLSEGRRWLEKALVQGRNLPAPLRAKALLGAGRLALEQGQNGQAQAFFAESLELYRALNYPIGMALLYHNLGYVELGQGNYREAAVLFGQSLGLLRTLEEKLQIAKSLAGLGGATLHLGNAEQAVRFLGAAQALLDSLAGQLEPVEQAEYEGHVAASQASLDAQTWQTAWTEGQSMPLEKLLEVALLS